jgi:CBS domain-containing protein
MGTDQVKVYMVPEVISIGPELSVLEAAKLMSEKKIGSVFIKEDDQYVGIFTETDLLRKVVALEFPPADMSVASLMNKTIETIDSESSMILAFITMQKKKLGHLAVTEGKEIVGVLSIKDIANYYVEKFSKK